MGYYNYRYFYAFLFWLDVGCMYLVCCTLPLIAWPDEDQFVRLYELLDSSNESDNWLLTWWRPFSRHEAPIFFILVLTAAAFVAVGGMLAMHTYLVLTNQTTIEWYHNGRMQKRAQRRGEVRPRDATRHALARARRTNSSTLCACSTLGAEFRLPNSLRRMLV